MFEDNYFTVSKFAKKMGVSVRTLHYYDKEKILIPSVRSKSGSRLYSYEDMVKLHQIKSLKALGFSLKEINKQLCYLNNPVEFAKMLEDQEEKLSGKIEELKVAQETVIALKKEALLMDEVDYKKYADIIFNYQSGNEYYMLIKYFDEELLDHIRNRFSEVEGRMFIAEFMEVNDTIYSLAKSGVPHMSDKTQEAIAKLWSLIMKFTGGDMSLVSKLEQFRENALIDEEWKQKNEEVHDYTEKGFEHYFKLMGESSE